MSTLDNRYEAVVPDTLDLAERAGLAVNALTGSADPERNYESYLCAHMDNRPAYFSHGAGGPCLPKPVQALPMMRVMSGSALRAGHDRKMLESGLQMIEDDGLLWLKVEGRPGFGDAWHRDLALFNTNPRFMITLLDWHRYDGNARWLEVAGRLAEGMARVAMRKEDRAWYSSATAGRGGARTPALRPRSWATRTSRPWRSQSGRPPMSMASRCGPFRAGMRKRARANGWTWRTASPVSCSSRRIGAPQKGR